LFGVAKLIEIGNALYLAQLITEVESIEYNKLRRYLGDYLNIKPRISLNFHILDTNFRPRT
jgi:hypothetical protein